MSSKCESCGFQPSYSWEALTHRVDMTLTAHGVGAVTRSFTVCETCVHRLMEAHVANPFPQGCAGRLPISAQEPQP
jgi:hypothetical protein